MHPNSQELLNAHSSNLNYSLHTSSSELPTSHLSDPSSKGDVNYSAHANSSELSDVFLTSHLVETGFHSVDPELRRHNLMQSPPLGGTSSVCNDDLDFYASVDRHIFEESVGT